MKKIILVLSLVFIIALTGCNSTGNNTDEFDRSSDIKVYTRDTTSGTREAFFKGIDFGDAVSDNEALVDGYIEVDGNGSMISSLVGDDFGIGYISLSSLEESGLRGLNFEDVVPSEANVLNNTYGLKRPFNYIIRDDWTNMDTERQIVEAFIAYMGTIDGKATISNEAGILETSNNDQLWDDIKDDYSVCELDNSNITIQFGGSTSVENVAKALSQEFSSKCGDFIFEHNHTGSGDGFKRTQGEESEGANKIHIGFASRDFKDSEPGADGTYGRLCWDAVVVVVSEINSTIDNITALDLRRIYRGEVATWDELN